MHKLDRTSVTAPACLAHYQHGVHTWLDVTSGDKQEIRDSLKQMQGSRCAYCEGAVYGHAHHIEHFRRKNPGHFPQFTFTWSNLFLSCSSADHCGRYKDRPGAAPYNPADLVKPDLHDPDDYLYFHSSGEVRGRSGIDSERQHQACETLRVFNLNWGALQDARRRALRQYQGRNGALLEELMDLDQATREEFIDAEIKATAGDPHCTVIRHFFERR